MQKEELRVWAADTQDNAELVWWDEERGGLCGSYRSPAVRLQDLFGGGGTTEGAVGMSQARREVKWGKAEGTAHARAGGGREHDVSENLLVKASLLVRVGV